MIKKENTSIFIQDTLHKNKILKLKDCKLWLSSIIKKNSEITIRIVNEDESESLNYNYRNQKKPTNILSFMISEDPLIGDIILCHLLIVCLRRVGEQQALQRQPYKPHAVPTLAILVVLFLEM